MPDKKRIRRKMTQDPGKIKQLNLIVQWVLPPGKMKVVSIIQNVPGREVNLAENRGLDSIDNR